jgi:hypothetical protein
MMQERFKPFFELLRDKLACIIREGSVSVAFGGRRLPKTMLAA